MAFIKTLIAGVERLIHGGKHYPVIDGVAKVPEEVRNELVGHTHWSDLNHAISEETVKALTEDPKPAEASEEVKAEEVKPEEKVEASEEVKKPEVKTDNPILELVGELAEAPKEDQVPAETAEAEVAKKPAKSSKKSDKKVIKWPAQPFILTLAEWPKL